MLFYCLLPMKIKLAKGLRKYLRLQKAQIRRTHHDEDARSEAINQIYADLGLKRLVVDKLADPKP